jgi:hypothetical protein
MSKAEDIRHQQLLAAIGQLVDASTALMAKLALRPAVNGVLDVGTYKLEAAGGGASFGILHRSYGVAAGSLIVSNPGSGAVTVAPGAPGPTIPTQGRGVFVCPAASVISVPMASEAFTLYGTTADSIGLQAFTGMQAYGVA